MIVTMLTAKIETSVNMREPAQRGERAEDRDDADRQRQAGRGEAAEDDDQQHGQDRQRDRLGPRDVGADLLVDVAVDRDPAADLDVSSPGARAGRPRSARGRRLRWSSSPASVEDGVGRAAGRRSPAAGAGAPERGRRRRRTSSGRAVEAARSPRLRTPGRRRSGRRCGRGRRRRRPAAELARGHLGGARALAVGVLEPAAGHARRRRRCPRPRRRRRTPARSATTQRRRR